MLSLEEEVIQPKEVKHKVLLCSDIHRRGSAD